MTLRKIVCVVFAIIASSYAVASQIIIPAPPQLAATAYLLIDADTGKVLVEKDANVSLPPASLTKMMTSYVISEEILAGRLKEQDLIRVSENAWRKGGAASGSSTMFLKPRSEVRVIDMIRGVIIQSGNDASIALAEHVAGSEEAFVDVMNQTASLLGMNSSHFLNATGWPAEGHLTTAGDLAILARAVINDHPEHYSIYAEKYFKHNGINQPNRNKLLFRNQYVDGLKTGHTKEAGYCLVASEKRNGMRLIAVVLGTKSEEARAAETQRLLAYGFRYFATHKLYSADAPLPDLTQRVWGGELDEVELKLDSDIVTTIPRGSRDDLNVETQIDSVIEAPITQGQELGKLVVMLDGEVVAEQNLVAATAVEQAGFIARIWDKLMLMVQGGD
jgi:D-alanyl-D-alanine carboxypeptidase (penicillin-binding protein 5/6)